MLSTQALIESNSELTALRKLIANGRFGVEANDMGAVNCLGGAPFVAGPHLNVYNPPMLSLLAMQGARRWVMPLEIGRAQLVQLHEARPAGVATPSCSPRRPRLSRLPCEPCPRSPTPA